MAQPVVDATFENKDEELLKNDADVIKEWITTGEDEYKAKFDSLIHVRCLNNYLKDHEIINLKDYKMAVNKKEKQITITRNAKVQKVSEVETPKLNDDKPVSKESKGTNPEAIKT